ncbi:MAG: uroporphyrinogen-III decarboxylase-like protein [Chloroflexi bacterium]|nr:uroporphyrinogen-III decarboxylase-like protein [Chloroflexota bacterium]
MNHKQRILAAICHERVDRVPTDIWATDEVWAKLREHLHVKSNIEVYDKLDIDGIVGIAPPYIGPPLRVGNGYRENEWGMGYRMQSYGSGAYEEQIHYPLAHAETIADLESYRWPSPDWYDYAALPALARQHPERAVECGYTAVFYYHNLLRGLEVSLMDPLLRPEFTHCLIDHLSDFFYEYHRRCFEATHGMIDTTQVTDDWGSQHGLLASEQVFNRFYRGATQRAIDLARSYGIHVFHHDDGDMRALLPTLAGMGIEILNPIQWRCGQWDLNALKSEYGRRLCFHSAVDNQETLPFGTPDDVRREVRWLIGALASDHTGFIIGPCHNLQPITPLDNILALYDAAREYGTFV